MFSQRWPLVLVINVEQLFTSEKKRKHALEKEATKGIAWSQMPSNLLQHFLNMYRTDGDEKKREKMLGLQLYFRC